jgi:predicted RNase H-like HicB family nuclease
MELSYTIILVPDTNGEFAVEVPALPGCFSRGKTILEAMRNAEEAIRCHLQAMRNHGERLPREGKRISWDTGDLAEGHILRVAVRLDEAKVA